MPKKGSQQQPWPLCSQHPSAPCAVSCPIVASTGLQSRLHSARSWPQQHQQQRAAAAHAIVAGGQLQAQQAALYKPQQLGDSFLLLTEPARRPCTHSCLTDWTSPLQVSTALLLLWRTWQQVRTRHELAGWARVGCTWAAGGWVVQSTDTAAAAADWVGLAVGQACSSTADGQSSMHQCHALLPHCFSRQSHHSSPSQPGCEQLAAAASNQG